MSNMNTNNQQDQQEKITSYKTKLGLVISLIFIFLLAQSLIIFRWYKSNRIVQVQESSFKIQDSQFNQLWQQLQEKTVSVELNEKIRYGEDIGKLEPFN